VIDVRNLIFNTEERSIAEKFSDEGFIQNRNVHYDLNFDPRLTYEKWFMEYCKQNNLDPVKAANTLKENKVNYQGIK